MAQGRPGGNPDIAKCAHLGGPKTDLGKFNVSLNRWKGESGRGFDVENIPPKIREMYSWFKSLSKSDSNFLFEIKGIVEVLKGNMMNNKTFLEKCERGIQFSKIELEQLGLMANLVEKFQKLKYGEKKIVAHVDVRNLRDTLFEDDNRRDK